MKASGIKMAKRKKQMIMMMMMMADNKGKKT
jgi:hypothetical protein